ncbi:glucose/arabinose dehydrogenase [Nakamurella flavida]|nr:PA14 domain-containing protein [Nakamurella flavida]MDP9778045.1 glucose/arabinose dehydrogenase [Nakamurella flavida]
MTVGLTVLSPPRPASAAVLADGFTDTTVAAVARPTAVAPTGDGRVLVASQTGQLRVVRDGALVPTPALDLAAAGVLCSNYERGLLGVAAGPASAGTVPLYLFYTARNPADTARNCPQAYTGQDARAPRNRVSRFLLGADDRVVPGSETVLLDGISSASGYHNAGDLHLGQDGTLFVSTGDGMCDYAGDSGCGPANDAARDRNALVGKIVRITTSGAVPADNPFASGSGTASCRTGPVAVGLTCREMYATGLRNPFRMAFDPDAATTSFRIHDVGQDLWEEIDQGIAGADYGWNLREGPCATGTQAPCSPTPAGLTDPVLSYPHSSGCASITGGAYVPDAAGWPAALTDGYLYADYVCGKIVAVSPSGSTTDLATELGTGSAVAMAFGPQFAADGAVVPGRQALYYTTYLGGGELHAITASGTANRPPDAVLTASTTDGPAPLAVTLDGSASSDPDGQALTYRFDPGDGSGVVNGAQPSVRHDYPAGTWTASLTVVDSAGATSAPATVVVRSGNTAPSVRILAPASGDLFTTGTSYPLRGEATDAQDGVMPASALRWTVIRHHDTHTHPYLGPLTGNALSLLGPEPEDLSATRNSWLEVQLAATDAQGATTTVSREFRPRLVPVTVATEPAGRRVLVNAETVTGGTTITSWAGFGLRVSVPAQTDTAGRSYGLDGWSDGGANAHTVTTPAAATTLTAALSLRGLQAAYFDGADFTGARVDRLDATVAFDWGSGSPAPSLGPDTFSARWTGQVQAPVSGTYTFSTTSDDGVRLWVGGRLLVDQWADHSRRTDTATITLTAGVRYPVAMEYHETGGAAVAQLRWSYPGQGTQIVPTDRLFPRYAVTFRPATSPTVPGWTTDSGGAFAARAGLRYGWNAPVLVRDRGATDIPDERYDTLALLQQAPNPTARWELALPSGSYGVRIVAGDPSWTDSIYALTAEGVPVVTGRATAAARWLDRTAAVTVSDGRLSITDSGVARNSKISFVEVSLR